jgi:CheY-like chemotaxis protein
VSEQGARIFVAEDAALNRKLLERLLRNEGHEVVAVEDGGQALDYLLANPDTVDVVLLDIMMPVLDGYAVLQRLKAEKSTSHIPVIMVTAVEDVESVARCIRDGATDYLPKPVDPAILHARLSASLAEKRLRDTEREYIQQVQLLTAAAAEVESGTYSGTGLDPVTLREDSLGQLARVFRKMAGEVQAREERLSRQVQELRIEIDQARRSAQVEHITGTDYFKGLRQQAASLREEL